MKNPISNFSPAYGANVFASFASFRREARNSEWTPDEIESVLKEAKAFHYDECLEFLATAAEGDSDVINGSEFGMPF